MPCHHDAASILSLRYRHGTGLICRRLAAQMMARGAQLQCRAAAFTSSLFTTDDFASRWRRGMMLGLAKRTRVAPRGQPGSRDAGERGGDADGTPRRYNV